jgi:uncharacterized protein YjbJ (UPF0337 family)
MGSIRDKAEGAKDRMKGQAQEAVGRITGNRESQAKGKKDQLKGSGKQAVGNVKQAGKNVKKGVEGVAGKRRAG